MFRCFNAKCKRPGEVGARRKTNSETWIFQKHTTIACLLKVGLHTVSQPRAAIQEVDPVERDPTGSRKVCMHTYSSQQGDVIARIGSIIGCVLACGLSYSLVVVGASMFTSTPRSQVVKLFREYIVMPVNQRAGSLMPAGQCSSVPVTDLRHFTVVLSEKFRG